jgi:anti-anti-sigma regulatory factor
MEMENLTNTNNDTDHRIIYEDEVCIITEHVNYIKVFFIKEAIQNTDSDFKSKFKELFGQIKFDKFLILDFINVSYCENWDFVLYYPSINAGKIILLNLKPFIMQEVSLLKFYDYLRVYSTFEDAIEYINKRIIEMENLTNANNDTDHRIIYNDEVCGITEHVNYIRVLIKKVISTDRDFKYKIREFIDRTKFDKFLIFDFIHCRYCAEWDFVLYHPLNAGKIILCNLSPYMRQELELIRLDTCLIIYSTFEEAVEYINKRIIAIENLTTVNKTINNKIIYEGKVSIIIEHVNYIKVFFFKSANKEDRIDFYEIENCIKHCKFEKLLIFDCKNVDHFSDEIIYLIKQINEMIYEYNKQKIIIFNLNSYLNAEFKMMKIDNLFNIYSTFEEAVEYINKKS